MKFFEDIKVEITAQDHIIIDARSVDRFKGLVDEPREGLRRGKIPHSVNLPFESLFDDYCLKTTDELKRIYITLAQHIRSIDFFMRIWYYRLCFGTWS